MMLTFLVVLLVAQNPLTHLPGPYSRESTETRATLQRHVLNYSVSGSSFVDALIEVAGRFKFPLGVAWVRNSSKGKPVHFSWKDATVQQVIWDIIHAQPGYETNVRNAVVHVQPSGLVSDRQNFLKLTIPRFDVHDQVAEVGSKRLFGLIKQRFGIREKVPGPSVRGGVGFSQGVEVGDPQISIILMNVTIEDALDSLILTSPFKIWLVTFAANGSLTPSGLRDTISPVTGKAIPYKYQPFWELLRWGRSPY